MLTLLLLALLPLQVVAVAYDNPIPGYGTTTTSNLRLWDAQPVDEFDLTAFNAGDYDKVREEGEACGFVRVCIWRGCLFCWGVCVLEGWGACGGFGVRVFWGAGGEGRCFCEGF